MADIFRISQKVEKAQEYLDKIDGVYNALQFVQKLKTEHMTIDIMESDKDYYRSEMQTVVVPTKQLLEFLEEVHDLYEYRLGELMNTK